MSPCPAEAGIAEELTGRGQNKLYGVSFAACVVWRDERVSWWYRQNIFVAAKTTLPPMDGSSRELPIDCVHPDLWERHLAPIGIRQLLRSARPALVTSVKHRLPHRLNKKPPTSPLS